MTQQPDQPDSLGRRRFLGGLGGLSVAIAASMTANVVACGAAYRFVQCQVLGHSRFLHHGRVYRFWGGRSCTARPTNPYRDFHCPKWDG
jgi:hypothetical protein